MAGKKDKPSTFTLTPGSEALKACETPEGAKALWEQLCETLGIEPKDENATTAPAEAEEGGPDSPSDAK